MTNSNRIRIAIRPLRDIISISTLLISAMAVSPAALGQFDRRDLGRRLLRFENAWQAAAPRDRATVVDPLQQAVQSFFSVQFGRASEKLDTAYLALRPGDQPASAFERWAIRFKLEVEPAVADADPAADELSIRLIPAYDSDDKSIDSASMSARLLNADGSEAARATWTTEELQKKQKWKIGPLGEGNYRIEATLRPDAGAGEIALPAQPLERIDRFTERITELEAARKAKASGSAGKSETTTASASVTHALTILKPAAAGAIQEIDYPIAHVLSLAEALTDPAASESDLRAAVEHAASGGDAWLSLARGKQRTTVRVRAPGDRSKSLPILFLFHGAGGSENMFFETYGAGRAVDLAIDRGWLVVAPRQELLGAMMTIDAMTDALEEFFDIDRSRIYLLGHSMGAAQVMRQASAAPSLPRAAAALGGGSSMRDAAKANGFPWYVAAGEKDFGRSGARALAKSLEQSGAQVTYREPADVEHLVIVQASLEEVFEFFDEAKKR